MKLDNFLGEERVAYFTMEIALRAEIPTYAGGLGVLAGDLMRSCADMELRLVAVSLVSRQGYFRQQIDDTGRQLEAPDTWQPEQWAAPLEARITVPIDGRSVWVGGWFYTLQERSGSQPVILLDTNVPENSESDRRITDSLYGGNDEYRLMQEIVLGIGGIRMLQALGFRIFHYHMNEGHSALLGLELLRRNAFPPEDLRPGESPYNVMQVREQCSFTTHTPVEAGHDKFSYDLVKRILDGYVDMTTIKRLAGDDRMNMTQLALNLSEFVNGVAERHAALSRQRYPGYHVRSITNGVHAYSWTSPPFARLYDDMLPGWRHEPELLVRADCCLSDEAIWQAHMTSKRNLLSMIGSTTGITFTEELPVLGFARRMTAYKRPDLLFIDIERLRQLARQHPFQLVLSGKAHPEDTGGKQLIMALHHHIRELADDIPIAYLPNYDMNIAQVLVAGTDLWLNTPLPPQEASGTSGMKAAFNGVPSLSILDGWWIEGCIEGVTGWGIAGSDEGGDRDAVALYDKLGQLVLPLYYDDRPGWIRVMKSTIAKNASFFNSHRMMRRYVTDSYIG